MTMTPSLLTAMAGSALLGTATLAPAAPCCSSRATNATQQQLSQAPTSDGRCSSSNALCIEQRPGQTPVVIINGERINENNLLLTTDGRLMVRDAAGTIVDLTAEMNRSTERWSAPEQLRNEQWSQARPVIGVRLERLSPALGTHLGLAPGEGALIAHVEPGMPAAISGLEQWDVIIAVNGEAVHGAEDLSSRLTQSGPDSALAMHVVRGGRIGTATVTPIMADMSSQRARGHQVMPAQPMMPTAGIRVQQRNDQDALDAI